jgi:hypothetical protein
MPFVFHRSSSTIPTSSFLRILLAACLSCWFARPASARADDPASRTSSLGWIRLQGAESCISTQALAQAVEERLGRKVFVSASEADVSVEGHVARASSPPRWRATLTIRDATGAELGTRDIDSNGESCSSLDEGVVLVVSLLIDPDAASSPPAVAPAEPEPAPPPAPPPTVVVERQRVLVPVPAPRPDDPWRVEVGAGMAASLGLLPAPSLGAKVVAIVEPPRFWGILVSGAYWFGADAEAERGAYADVTLAHAGAGLCPLRLAAWRVSYRICAAVDVGSMRSNGHGFDTQGAEETLSVHATLPNRLALRIAGPLVASVGLDLIFPLARTEIGYRASDGSRRVLFQPSPVAASADLGLGLHFPP